MRSYGRPPKEVNTELPSGFSEGFVKDLLAAIDTADYGFKGSYWRDNILSKYCDPTTTSASIRRERAIEKWMLAERRNEKTNARIFHHDVMETDLGWTTFPELLTQIRSLISRILGPIRYPEILTDLLPSNGASTRIRRSERAALSKLMGEAHVSSTALKHWFACASNTRLSEQTLTLEESSDLFTVPKNSDIDRAACKEPEINMWMQRSVGKTIQRRLRKVGIDLKDQSINQRLAATAVQNGLATVDLSSASDSISRGLVSTLLPFDWHSLLDDLRVHSTIIDGEHHTLEMFSSMGNGFTFELESLIFYAVTRVVCKLSGSRGRVSVYGDDIIAPSSVIPRLIRVFHLLGFKTNAKKTFWTGNFRESCGKHYFRGFDVTPFFVRRKVSQLPDLINLLNQVLEWSGRGLGFIEDPKILAFHRKYAMFVPPYLWGGVDTTDSTCLVTGHAPRYRLARKVRPLDFDQGAGICLWFMARESADEAVSVVPFKQTRHIAVRCSKGWNTSWRPWFLEGNQALQGRSRLTTD